MVTVTMLSDDPAIYIRPYNQTTTKRIGTNVTVACLNERKPIERVMKTNREPSPNEDCISLCMVVEATKRVTGRPVGMTHVNGLSSLSSPASSWSPVERFVNGERSLQTSSIPPAMPGKSSGAVIPNRISIRSYAAGSPFTSSHGLVGSSSTSGAM